MSTKKVTVTVTEHVRDIQDNARNQENTRIQDKVNEVLDSKGLPPVDLSDEDPFKVTERNKRG